jgi:hypothetical protein
MKRRSAVDLAVDAYVAWREACVAVRAAYVSWRRAPSADATRAFHAYQAALDREELAAKVYAELIRRVGFVADIGVARQPAYPAAAPGDLS